MNVQPPSLITGGAGFIGCNLADRLACYGEHVLVLDDFSRPGAEANAEWLRARHPDLIEVIVADVRDRRAVSDAVSRCRAVFHLAAQVAVTTSLADPGYDLEVNVLGTFALLDAVRQRAPDAPLVFASTNKVYGDLEDVQLADTGEGWMPRHPALRARGFDEKRPLDFRTPYGCSKGAADQYVLDYARSLGLRGAVLRMSCIYGPRQLGTEDQGWVAHFLLRAIAGETIVLYGDGRQMRDILRVEDAISAYVAARDRIEAISGSAFNLGGGPANAVSLLGLIDYIGELLGRRVVVEHAPWRPHDQRYFVADTRRVRAALGLGTPIGWRPGVADLLRRFAGPRADHELPRAELRAAGE